MNKLVRKPNGLRYQAVFAEGKLAFLPSEIYAEAVKIGMDHDDLVALAVGREAIDGAPADDSAEKWLYRDGSSLRRWKDGKRT